MRVRKSVLVAALLTLTLLLSACAGEEALQEGGGEGGGEESAQPTGAPATDVAEGEDCPVIVGSANFTEQLILANMYAEVIEQQAGTEVERRLNLGSREVVFPSLRSGELTLLPEYSGALLAFLTQGEAPEKEPEPVMEALRGALPDGIVALEPSEAQDKDGLAVTQETAEEFDLETISDLEGVASDFVVGGPAEMEERDVGLPGLEEVYGLEFENFRALDAGGPLTTEALSSGQIDVGRVFTTQGVIDERNWVVLEDDMNLAPAQEIVPVGQECALTDEVETALNELSAALTTEDLITLNKRVSVDKEDPEDVAVDFLEQEGLVSGG